jgi:hypothetical protein
VVEMANDIRRPGLTCACLRATLASFDGDVEAARAWMLDAAENTRLYEGCERSEGLRVWCDGEWVYSEQWLDLGGRLLAEPSRDEFIDWWRAGRPFGAALRRGG